MNPRERRRQRRIEMTEKIAYRLYEKRSRRGYEGSSDKDWLTAEKIARNPIARRSFWLNQWLKRRWRGSISWYESTIVEHGLETLTEDLKNLAIFDLMSLLANLAIIISLGSFLTGGEQQRHDQQVYEAWQIITAAHGQPGSGGRRRALEFLNSSPGTLGRRRWLGLPWPKEDLRGVDVSKANLTGIKLPEAQLKWAILENADLQGAILRWADLQRANLREANLREADLQGTNLWQADLQGAILRWADLQGAILRSANLQRTDLRWADLQGTNLWQADLQKAILGRADLQGTNLWQADLQGAILRWADLQEAHLGRADLQRAHLGQADLQEANLWQADLQEANLGQTDLQGALLLATDLRASKDLTPQQLEKAKLCHTALPSSVQDIKPDRDCEAMPQALVEYYERISEKTDLSDVITLEYVQESPRYDFSFSFDQVTLKDAQAIVNQARQREWDDLE